MAARFIQCADNAHSLTVSLKRDNTTKGYGFYQGYQNRPGPLLVLNLAEMVISPVGFFDYRSENPRPKKAPELWTWPISSSHLAPFSRLD